MPAHSAPVSKRRRFTPIALLAGVAGVVLLSLSLNSTLSAFTASITNSNNTAASGTLTMQEANGATTCNSTDSTTINVNAATCATINKYGGSTVMAPTNVAGTSNLVTTTITIKNTGTIAAGTFTLTAGACTPSANGTPTGSGNLCTKLNVAIYAAATATGTPIFTGTPAAFNTANGAASPLALTAPAAGVTQSYTFVVSLPNNADNTFQGLSASQPLIWTFTS